MPSETKRNIFWLTWLLIVLSAPVTVLVNSSLKDVFSNSLVFINFFQRIAGLLAFNLLFMQIILGVFMDRWIQAIGSQAYKIHTTQGLFAYGLFLVHPLFESALVYELTKSITDTFLVLLPSFRSQRDIYLVFGKTALILVTISFIAAYFRTKPFFRRNWRAFHILNYLVFYLIFIHMKVGTDITTPPFVWVSWLALISISGSVFYRVFRPVYQKLHQIRDIKKKLEKA